MRRQDRLDVTINVDIAAHRVLRRLADQSSTRAAGEWLIVTMNQTSAMVHVQVRAGRRSDPTHDSICSSSALVVVRAALRPRLRQPQTPLRARACSCELYSLAPIMQTSRRACFHPDITYRISPICARPLIARKSACATVQTACTEPTRTLLYWVERSNDSGHTCRSGIHVSRLDDEGGVAAGHHAGKVLAAMKKLEWPEAELTIQPPDGRRWSTARPTSRPTPPEPATQTITLLRPAGGDHGDAGRLHLALRRRRGR